jgi:CDP-glycerol glycerophosphotransferase
MKGVYKLGCTDIYIDYKKYVALLIIRIFNYFPIKKNKIFIYSYYGNQYGCNPKYISEYLVENYRDKYDIVWAFNNMSSKGDIKGIRAVKNFSLKYLYEICTAKVIITNFRTTELFKKRKNQYYIQTWHSSLRLKKIEGDSTASLKSKYIDMAKADSKKIDLLLSGCKFSTDIFKRAFWYDGKILECGTPRIDILINEKVGAENRVKEKLRIPIDTKIILYAPTFRKDNELGIYNLDYERVIKEFEDVLGGNWIFLVRLHPHLVEKSKLIVHGHRVIDVTSYDDVQELLVEADVLISDYSSLMFDFGLTNKPCFLFVPDIDIYTQKDRELYFDIYKLPFSSACTNDELIEVINCFNKENYLNKLRKFYEDVGSIEDGECCRRLSELIYKVCWR